MTTTFSLDSYQPFLKSPSKRQWKRIGLKRRAGVAVPLFSLYSKSSVGIGELPDLKLLVDWCLLTRMSIIQLLPMNDVGFGFTPYDAESTFALEPMYLSLRNLAAADAKPFKKDLESLSKGFPPGKTRVDYDIKVAKLELLWGMFEQGVTPLTPTLSPEGRGEFGRGAGRKGRRGQDPPRPLKGGEGGGVGVRSAAFARFARGNEYWLRDYALFKVLKEKNEGKAWWEWPGEFRERNPEALNAFEKENHLKIRFYQWLQYELFKQFRKVKEYAGSKGILLMGDLPFLVSRDSADVWSHPDYFKLDLAAGAPPDRYCAKGQRWGMPPYRWENISARGFDHLIERFHYAENFYDLFRIDHAVGLFRLWSIPFSEPLENAGVNGFFDPPDEREWEGHGRRFLEVMLENTSMLPCAEDLGVIPECSHLVLREFGIPGMDVQRWSRDWESTYEFKSPDSYRPNSVAVLSTHDMTPLLTWWQFEAGTIDEALFQKMCETRGISFEAVRDKLFDLEHSVGGRLRWKDDIDSEEEFLRRLNLRREEARDFIELHQGTFDEREKFWNYLGLPGKFTEKATQPLVRRALEKLSRSSSIFNIQFIQDWLALGPIRSSRHPRLRRIGPGHPPGSLFKGDPWELRIKWPGTRSDKNWTFVLPISLEEMKQLNVNKELRMINRKAGRE